MLAIMDSVMKVIVTGMTIIVGVSGTAIIAGWLIGLVRRKIGNK